MEFTEEEIIDEAARWNKAMVVYVLAAKPPFYAIKQFLEKR